MVRGASIGVGTVSMEPHVIVGQGCAPGGAGRAGCQSTAARGS